MHTLWLSLSVLFLPAIRETLPLFCVLLKNVEVCYVTAVLSMIVIIIEFDILFHFDLLMFDPIAETFESF